MNNKSDIQPCNGSKPIAIEMKPGRRALAVTSVVFGVTAILTHGLPLIIVAAAYSREGFSGMANPMANIGIGLGQAIATGMAIAVALALFPLNCIGVMLSGIETYRGNKQSLVPLGLWLRIYTDYSPKENIWRVAFIKDGQEVYYYNTAGRMDYLSMAISLEPLAVDPNLPVPDKVVVTRVPESK